MAGKIEREMLFFIGEPFFFKEHVMIYTSNPCVIQNISIWYKLPEYSSKPKYTLNLWGEGYMILNTYNIFG